MKESRDGTRNDRSAKSSSVSTVPLILDIDDFKVNTVESCFACVNCVF